CVASWASRRIERVRRRGSPSGRLRHGGPPYPERLNRIADYALPGVLGSDRRRRAVPRTAARPGERRGVAGRGGRSRRGRAARELPAGVLPHGPGRVVRERLGGERGLLPTGAVGY